MRKYSVFAIAREAMRGHKGWEEQWTGNPAGVDVSSAEMAELKAAMSEQRTTKHKGQYLHILHELRTADYVRAREEIVQSTRKDFHQAATLHIIRTRCKRRSTLPLYMH